MKLFDKWSTFNRQNFKLSFFSDGTFNFIRYLLYEAYIMSLTIYVSRSSLPIPKVMKYMYKNVLPYLAKFHTESFYLKQYSFG